MVSWKEKALTISTRNSRQGAPARRPLLEKAVRRVEVDATDQPVVIADYGSSQGKNSMVPMQVAIQNLRQRLGPDRPISVFHVDQASNDFNTLFEILNTDPHPSTNSKPLLLHPE